MSLIPGTRLGPYQIVAPIGAGGMGEVYRARDTRLDRSVAIKVLPPDVSADPDRRARFDREARNIAALNHPHICTLHDVGHDVPADQDGRRTAEGGPDGPVVDYLVMEHLQGETLADRLDRGPLPPDQALAVAAEVADALAAAHRQGIVHRDVKPGNVMLTKAGAKLLDFGLAKLKAHGEQPAAAALASAPTRSVPLTGQGTIVGTLQYMAPEQVEGKPADARTDLWALGAILYEMLTGRRAFEGASAASLITAIMGAEPAPIASLQPLTPPALDRLVRKCLAKDPDTRWQAASDVADELRWIRGGSGAVTAPAVAPRARRARAFAIALGALLVLIAVAAGWFAYPAFGPALQPAHVTQSFLGVNPAIELDHAMTYQGLARPAENKLALTPDGRRLVFAGQLFEEGQDARAVRQFYVRSLEDAESRPIKNTRGGYALALSPDGKWIVFWVRTTVRLQSGSLKKVQVDGGDAPVEIARTEARPVGISWGDDDSIVFAGGDTTGLSRVPGGGGKVETVTTLGPGEYSHRLPHVLPGARAVLFTVVRRFGDWESAQVVVHRFGEKGWKVIAEGAADARYVRSGHLIYFRRGRLMAVPFDLDRLEKTGQEVGILSDVMQATNGVTSGDDSGAAQVAVSASGTLVYVSGGEVPDVTNRLVWVDGRGQVEPLKLPPKHWAVPRVSPDGRKVAAFTVQRNPRLWVFDIRTPESPLQVTGPDVIVSAPVWTRDSARLVFAGSVGGRAGLYSVGADGGQTPEPVALRGSNTFPGSWTPEGQLLFMPFSAAKSWDIGMLSRDGSGAWVERELLAMPAMERDAQLSPDGKWLAYSSNETGSLEVYVRRFPSLTDRRQLSSGGGSDVLWSRNGRQLFYVGYGTIYNGDLVAHDVGADGPVPSTARRLFRPDALKLGTATPVPGFDVAADGRFIFTQRTETPATYPSAPRQIHLIQNWFAVLKAKAPAR